MNGCFYRTKDNECDLWTDDKHKSFCDPDCKDKHPSNADRIRSMTDEELARYITAEEMSVILSLIKEIDNDFFDTVIEEVNRRMGEVVSEKLEWLKQEYGT